MASNINAPSVEQPMPSPAHLTTVPKTPSLRARSLFTFPGRVPRTGSLTVRWIAARVIPPDSGNARGTGDVTKPV